MQQYERWNLCLPSKRLHLLTKVLLYTFVILSYLSYFPHECSADTVKSNYTLNAIQQRAILNLFFHSTGGIGHWIENSKWPTLETYDNVKNTTGIVLKDPYQNSDANDNMNAIFHEICERYGIECEIVTSNRVLTQHSGKVTSIQERVDLSISSTLYKIIGIDLWNNSLIGTIPWEIFCLPEIRYIQLPYNGIEAIDFQLRSPDQSINIIQGSESSIHDHNLSAITENYETEVHEEILSTDLKLAKMWRSHISTEIHKLRGLSYATRLNIASNNLTFAGENEMKNVSLDFFINCLYQFLPKLEYLNLSQNLWNGYVPDLRHFQHLRTINFTSSGLIGTLPPSLLETSRNYQRTLEMNDVPTDTFTIDLSSNNINGTIPKEFAVFDQLNIFLRDNQIQHIPDIICNQSMWMQSTVELFDCNAILCPPKTFASPHGRQIHENLPCTVCNSTNPNILFYGQSGCEYEYAKDENRIWRQLKSRTFWMYFSLFVLGLAGLLTCMKDD